MTTSRGVFWALAIISVMALSLIGCAITDTVEGAEDCDNGVDDDGDGYRDCADHDCVDDSACGARELCDNGVDDDDDGRVDCDDVDCGGHETCGGYEHCYNDIDDDEDGQIDCEDP